MLVARYFEKLDPFFGAITSNSSVAIGEPLYAARVLDDSANVFVVDFPDDASVTPQLDDPITVRATDDRVPISESYRRKWPVPSFFVPPVHPILRSKLGWFADYYRIAE